MSQHVSQRRAAPPDAPPIPSRLQLWAASLAIEAGIVHVIAGSDHFREWWAYGVFFSVVSLCQMTGGVTLLVSSSRWLYWVGIFGTAAVLAVWAVSRTVGVPIGPDGIGPERVGLLDTICVVCEVGLIWCLWRLLRQPRSAALAGTLNRPHM